MLEEISNIVGLQVYTNNGLYLGNVSNVIVNIDESKIESLFVSDTNPHLVEASKSVSVPFRWVSSIGDIVILRYFPKRVSLKKEKVEEKIL